MFTSILSHFKERRFLKAITILLITVLFLPLFLLIDALVVMLIISRELIKYVDSHSLGSEQQTIVLDLHSIARALRTSLEEPVRLSALSYLATITLPDIDPALVVGCFDVLVGCIKTTNGSAAITQGSEKLATLSALCCLSTLSHLALSQVTSRVTTVDLTPRVFEGIPQ